MLKLGDKVRIKGPKGQFKYTPELSREIGMIAGGTGITPMLQILRAALHNPLDRTKFSLIYANVNVEDILCRTELDELVARHPLRINILYVLNNPPPNWKGGVGFVSKEQIKERLPSPAKDIKVLLCGPPPMMTAMKYVYSSIGNCQSLIQLYRKHLDELKYTAPNTVSKLKDQVSDERRSDLRYGPADIASVNPLGLLVLKRVLLTSWSVMTIDRTALCFLRSAIRVHGFLVLEVFTLQ